VLLVRDDMGRAARAAAAGARFAPAHAPRSMARRARLRPTHGTATPELDIVAPHHFPIAAHNDIGHFLGILKPSSGGA